jgi:HAD superfamily hydrolase (TIGR01490 family)
MEIFCGKCGAGKSGEESGAGGGVKNKEVNEVQEVKEVKERHSGVAAFFDLDGTLVAEPTLEREFFRELRWRGRIPVRNYFLWIAEAVRLAPQGVDAVLQGNKMYLKNVAGNLAESVMGKHAPQFYREGLQRVEWHVREGHFVYLLSGTLECLASCVALAMAARLAVRGVHTRIGFCATRLEEDCGCWTGRTTGEAMFGEAKARAVRRIANQEGYSLEKSYAYGNSMSDRWMLGAVGRGTAVNPSAELERMANLQGWPVMRWKEQEGLTQRHRDRREDKKEVTKTEVGLRRKTILAESEERMNPGSAG